MSARLALVLSLSTLTACASGHHVTGHTDLGPGSDDAAVPLDARTLDGMTPDGGGIDATTSADLGDVDLATASDAGTDLGPPDLGPPDLGLPDLGTHCMATSCDAHASCIDTSGAPVCTCMPGWMGSGVTCMDVDECTSGAAGCSPFATCTNTAGSFTCTCGAGYTGDGHTCTPISTGGCTTLEGFESGTFPTAIWTLASGGGAPVVATTSAHDGTYGLADSGSNFYVESGTTIGRAGDRLRAWMRGTSGRFYLCFDATTAGAKCLAVAPNTGGLLFQDNTGWGYTEFAMTSFAFAPSHWYLAEVSFNGTGNVTGNLYDSDGSTLLATLSHDYGAVGVQGVAFRTFSMTDADTFQTCH